MKGREALVGPQQPRKGGRPVAVDLVDSVEDPIDLDDSVAPIKVAVGTAARRAPAIEPA